MDETESHWKETIAGCLAILLLLAATVIFARCSQPANTEIEITLLKAEPVESVGYDFSDNAARALADLDAYLITVTTTTTATAPSPVPNFDQGDGSHWDQLAQCETGGNWAANTGNGFGGGLQFMHQRSYSTWLSFGGGDYAAHPWEASREQQIAVAEKVLASSGWNAWPGCSRKFGWI